MGQKRAFSGQKARQCVPQCILGGVAVLFTVRKHACAPEATPGLTFVYTTHCKLGINNMHSEKQVWISRASEPLRIHT